MKVRYHTLLSDSPPIHHSVSFGKNVRIGHSVVIEKECKIGDNTIIAHHCVLRPQTIIGKDSLIGHLTVFEGNAVVGDRVTIHAQCHVTKESVIEDDVFIAPFFCSGNTARITHGRPYPLVIDGVKIRRAARIAIGVITLPGVEIGHNALIGAGSIVTKNVPPMQIWYGSPAIMRGYVPLDELL